MGPHISNTNKMPHRVPNLSATRVAAGAFHTVACTPDGQIFSCGSNRYGQLGVGFTGANLFKLHAVHLPAVEVCDVSCGPDSSLAISTAGVVYVWGMLMSERNDAHQYQPRKLQQPFEANLFISRAAMGKLHIALVADSAFTRLLRNAIATMWGKADTPYGVIKRDMLMMPLHAASVQGRAQQWLAEASDGTLPHFTLDKSSFRIVPEFKEEGRDSITTRVITFINHSDFAVDVLLQMPGQERYQTSRVAIDAEPSRFTVDRQSRQAVHFTISCHLPPLEDLQALFFFEARRRLKKGKAGGKDSLKAGGAAASIPTRFYILLCVAGGGELGHVKTHIVYCA